jgi:hypothetical protein
MAEAKQEDLALTPAEEEKVQELLRREVTRRLLAKTLPDASEEEIVRAVRRFVRDVTERSRTVAHR